VPALYTLIARNTRSPEHVSRLIDALYRRAGNDASKPESPAMGRSPP
jgi:hypothetical protein